MNADKPVEITLRLTPAAYGLLVAMAAYDHHPSVEACIMEQMAGEVSSWCEATGDTEGCKELFLTGTVERAAKEAA